MSNMLRYHRGALRNSGSAAGLRSRVVTEAFSHAGDAGDLIAALPAVRAASKSYGGGRLTLYPANFTRQRMSPTIVRSLASLLEQQPYLKSVDFAEHSAGFVLDVWRRLLHRSAGSIADFALEVVGASLTERNVPWLCVEPKAVASVVFARSARLRDPTFPWGAIVKRWRADAVFVGYQDEHKDFVSQWGYVPWVETKDYLALAQLLAGSRLVVVNQTSTFWVGFGLGCRVLLEQAPIGPRNCDHDVSNMLHFSSHDELCGALRSGERGLFD